MANIKNKIILSLAFAAVVYIALSFWGNFGDLREVLANFKWYYFPLLLALAFINYLVRFAKWHYYLKILKIKIPKMESFKIFLAGFSMSITPGKLGEVLKSYLLKDKYQIPISKTAMIVFADRLTDMVALIVISAVGVFGYNFGKTYIWIISAVVLLIIILIEFRPVAERILRALTKLKFLKKRAQKLENLYESSYEMIRPKHLAVASLISIFAWSCECLGLYLTFIAFDFKTGVLAAFFIYAFSTILGAITMLPGGLGATEGTMTGLTILLGIPKGISAAATIIIRAATLWFAVIIGVVALLIVNKGNDTHRNISPIGHRR